MNTTKDSHMKDYIKSKTRNIKMAKTRTEPQNKSDSQHQNLKSIVRSTSGDTESTGPAI